MIYKLPTEYSKLTSQEKRAVRQHYIKEQDGLCYWCGYSLEDSPPEEIINYTIDWSLFPKGFLNYPIHLQHDHSTDLTEGAVHALCNAVMWQYFGK